MNTDTSYLNLNAKPTRPEEQPAEPTDPDDPIIEDPPEPTDPEDPIREPVKSSGRYDPNNLQNYVRDYVRADRIRAPGRNEVH